MSNLPIDDMLKKVPSFVALESPFMITWGAESIGWGEFYFYVGEDKLVHCRNEIMSKHFIKEQLCKMVDECILDEPPSIVYRSEKRE